MSTGRKLVLPPKAQPPVEEPQHVEVRPREPEPEHEPDEIHGPLVRAVETVTRRPAPLLDRLLPQSEDAEKSLLSSFVLAPEPVAAMCAEKRITSAHFFSPHCAETFDALMHLHERKMLKGDGGDFIVLTQYFRDTNRLAAMPGGAVWPTDLYTFLPTAANCAYYIEILWEKWALRESIKLTTRLTERAYTAQDEVWAMVEESRQAVLKLADSTMEARGLERGVETLTIKELLDFDTADNPDTIIGRHWLMRGGSAIWVGPSGIGKSSLALQIAVHFAMGLPFCGITPKRPLKSVFMQAENDLGDLAEMAQGVMQHIAATMTVTQEMMDLCKANLVFVRDMIHVGEEFAGAVRRLCRKHKPDVFWADPLLSYVGDDISKQAVASHFFRDLLNPILTEFGVCMMFMHHTGKPPTDPKARSHWNDSDMAYAGFGSSELTNWPRAYNVLRPVGDGVYELHLTKRGKRAGARDVAGQFTDKIYLAHAEEGIAWKQVPKPEENEEENPRQKKKGRDSGQFTHKFPTAFETVLAILAEPPPKGDVWDKFDCVQETVRRLGCSDKSVYPWIAELRGKGQLVELPGAKVRLP